MIQPKAWNWRLIGILALGLGLRCIQLSTRSIFYDDAFSYFLSKQSWQAIISGTAADTMPPLYYFLLHIWLQVNDGIGWLRFLSVLLTLGGIFLLYFLVTEIAGKTAGLWAAFFSAISPQLIYHAQDLRMYALLSTAQIGYCLFFIRTVKAETAEWGNWIWLVTCGTIAMYTHNLAVFTLIVPNIFLLIGRDWRRLKSLLLAQIVIGFFSIPWLLMIPGQVDKIQRAFWTPQPGMVEVIQAAMIMTTNLPLDPNWLMVGAIIGLELLVLLIMFLIRNRIPKTRFLILLWVLPPLLLFITSYLMRPVFVSRGFLASTLAYLGLAGVVITRMNKKWITGLLVGGFTLASLISLPYQLKYEEFPRSPFKRAVETVAQQIQPGEIIVHDNKLSAFPAIYYAPYLEQRFVADEPGTFNDTYALASQQAIGLIPDPSIEGAVNGTEGVYFFTFQKAIDEYKAGGLNNHPSLEWLLRRYNLVEKQVFRDLLVFHFHSSP